MGKPDGTSSWATSACTGALAADEAAGSPRRRYPYTYTISGPGSADQRVYCGIASLPFSFCMAPIGANGEKRRKRHRLEMVMLKNKAKGNRYKSRICKEHTRYKAAR